MSPTSVKVAVFELPSSTLMLESVGDSKVADLQGLSSVIVKVYPLLFVPAVSSNVVVTVKVVDVPCSEVSVVTTLTVRPVIEIQLAEGDIVRVSVYVHPES